MCDSKCGDKCIPVLICKILLIIGGINWGLIGIGMLMNNDWNVVHMVLGAMPTLEAIVYVLVGVAAIMKIFGCKCKRCVGGECINCETGSMDKKM
ncbi:MAG: DUF378 domain-containing protein [Patescibacteria group bacterium]